MTTKDQTIKKGQTLEGIVVSNKMDKTVVVEVARFIKHPKYGKFVTIHKKIKAHDEENLCQVGDKVRIKMTKPFSKDKSFEVIK